METLYINEHTTSCKGEEGALGHPLIYLNLSKNGDAVCPYCSKHFKLKIKSENKNENN